jgi:hypothetical protein
MMIIGWIRMRTINVSSITPDDHHTVSHSSQEPRVRALLPSQKLP